MLLSFTVVSERFVSSIFIFSFSPGTTEYFVATASRYNPAHALISSSTSSNFLLRQYVSSIFAIAIFRSISAGILFAGALTSKSLTSLLIFPVTMLPPCTRPHVISIPSKRSLSACEPSKYSRYSICSPLDPVAPNPWLLC